MAIQLTTDEILYLIMALDEVRVKNPKRYRCHIANATMTRIKLQESLREREARYKPV